MRNHRIGDKRLTAIGIVGIICAIARTGMTPSSSRTGDDRAANRSPLACVKLDTGRVTDPENSDAVTPPCMVLTGVLFIINVTNRVKIATAAGASFVAGCAMALCVLLALATVRLGLLR